jgi:formamidopyrimidine-DNA glycosylase
LPELPDITVYIEALEHRIVGHTLEQIRIANPFLVRSVDPPIKSAEGKQAKEIRRIGKRIAIGFEGELWIVIHLMIAGRFRWLARGAKVPGKLGLAAFDFDNGSLILTEGRIDSPRVALCCSWNEVAGRNRSRRNRAARMLARGFCRAIEEREPHAEEIAD